MTDDPTMVTVAVSASGSASKYHIDDDCNALGKCKTRQVPRDAVPNRDLCRRCAGDGVGGANTQSRDINNFAKNFDATDVERGELADAVTEECE